MRLIKAGTVLAFALMFANGTYARAQNDPTNKEIAKAIGCYRSEISARIWRKAQVPEVVAQKIFKTDVQLNPQQLKLKERTRNFRYSSVFLGKVTIHRGTNKPLLLVTQDPERVDGLSMHNVPLYIYGAGPNPHELLTVSGINVVPMTHANSGYPDLLVVQHLSAIQDVVEQYKFAKTKYQLSKCFLADYGEQKPIPSIKEQQCH